MIPRYNRFLAPEMSLSTTEFPMNDAFLVSVVDDDESLRESLEGLLKSLGYGVKVFSSRTRGTFFKIMTLPYGKIINYSQQEELHGPSLSPTR